MIKDSFRHLLITEAFLRRRNRRFRLKFLQGKRPKSYSMYAYGRLARQKPIFFCKN